MVAADIVRARAPPPNRISRMTLWGIVTGASGGLGQAYARYLASSGLAVGLVARNVAAMERLARELSEKWGVETRIWACDLTAERDRASLISDLAGLRVNTLVNNAGYGLLGGVADLDAARQSEMVTLNCVALTELTQAVLPQMLDEAQGTIINVASTAAFQPIPRMAAYAGSKAYVLRFTEGLWAETRRSGVRVIAICPGPTDTAFFEVAGDDQVMAKRRTPEQVVQTTFAGLRANKPYAVDGPTNSFLAALAGLTPARLAMRISAQMVSR